MHTGHDYLVGLAQLHQLASPEERRAVWRQGLAALAAAATNQQPTPLEGLPPDELLSGVRVALATGLVDDLGWLSKPVAGAALFELAAALPAGQEKRELGRRVLKDLHEGDAATFVSLARSLALGSRRALSGPLVRARVALSLRLPLGAGTGADALALSLLARPDLEREWLTVPSTGGLPSRRLAARLLERAAREAARRAQEGDDGGVRVFERASVRAAWSRLLADRESLVWRHVATARGLLLAAIPTYAEDIDRALSPRQSPTEWRRAAASVAASIAHDPVAAAARCRDLARGGVSKRDPGVQVAMVYGLSRAGEEEPEAAEQLLGMLVQTGDLEVMEALVDVRREHVGSEFGAWAAATALARLRSVGPMADDGLCALCEAVADDLAAEAVGGASLHDHLSGALQAFAEGRDLRPATEAALHEARATLAALEQVGAEDTPEQRQAAFRALRELDRGLLEASTLAELVAVCGLDTNGTSALGELYGRLGNWLLSREQTPLREGPVDHPTLRLRRLRTLLHLIDSEGGGGDEAAVAASRDRRLRAFRVLLGRVEADPPSPLRRTLCAALARVCDALVRDEVCEVSDVLVAVSSQVRAAADLHVLCEASMAPEVKDVFRAAAEVARLLSAGPDTSAERSFLEAFQALAQTLPPGTSPRVEGLRRALLGMARGLDPIAEAVSLTALQKGEGAVALERLEEVVYYGAQLCAGVRRRLALGGGPAAPVAGRALRELGTALDRAVRDLDGDLPGAVQNAVNAFHVDLPVGIADVLTHVIGRIPLLPQDVSMEINLEGAHAAGAPPRLRLPPWLPPSRILGGFYVLRPIGNGAGGSVFVARRSDERHDEHAETYALKVPAYSGQNAHTLSENEFMQLFREEAGALLTIPQHNNLAGFVTFDARARPKPILVMELVHGPTLERILDKRELSVGMAFAILDGIASGLEVMHGVGVGHLDVKPANIILKSSEGSGSKLVHIDQIGPTPVLVDFGLAGRTVRPGCASPFYGAPEVWDAHVYEQAAGPAAVDVYAFCCLAYEMLTGRTLFDGETLPALIASHVHHDGNPPALARLRTTDRRLATFADIMAAGLARDPRRRATISQIREALRSLRRYMEGHGWPVAA